MTDGLPDIDNAISKLTTLATAAAVAKDWDATVETFARCQRCGHCCRDLILEATDLDALREPRIAAEGRMMISMEGPEFSICAAEPPHHCIFLRDANRCDIYATRPNMCVGFGPDDERCLVASPSPPASGLQPPACQPEVRP